MIGDPCPPMRIKRASIRLGVSASGHYRGKSRGPGRKEGRNVVSDENDDKTMK